MLSEDLLDGFRLYLVIQLSGCAVRIDVAYVLLAGFLERIARKERECLPQGPRLHPSEPAACTAEVRSRPELGP